jgi:hypothetical protein
MKLTDRQLEVLKSLAYAHKYGFVRPMDLGGTDASHHSHTLAALVRKGLAKRQARGGLFRGAWRYRITDAGLALLSPLRGGGEESESRDAE